MWHLGEPKAVSKSKELRRVENTPAERFAVAAGGKVKRTVVAEYANLQEHVRRVGGAQLAQSVC